MFCQARQRCKLYRARSRLYRSRFLQVSMRLEALAEIYTIHSFALLSNRNCLLTIAFLLQLPNCIKSANFFRNFAEFQNLLNFELILNVCSSILANIRILQSNDQ